MTAAQGTCVYCGREMWLAGLKPCCDKPEHAGSLVCKDIRGCVDVVLTRLHESVAAGELGPQNWGDGLGDSHHAHLCSQRCTCKGSAQAVETAARKLAEIERLVDVFDWEHDDAHYALEQVDDVLRGGGGR